MKKSELPVLAQKAASMDGDKMIATLHHMFGEAMSTVVPCPMHGSPMVGGLTSSMPCIFTKDRLYQIVMHLNDAHDWSRDQIADWVESLGLDLTQKIPASEAITKQSEAPYLVPKSVVKPVNYGNPFSNEKPHPSNPNWQPSAHPSDYSTFADFAKVAIEQTLNVQLQVKARVEVHKSYSSYSTTIAVLIGEGLSAYQFATVLSETINYDYSKSAWPKVLEYEMRGLIDAICDHYECKHPGELKYATLPHIAKSEEYVFGDYYMEPFSKKDTDYLLKQMTLMKVPLAPFGTITGDN